MAPKRLVIEEPPPADSSSEEEQEPSEENDAVEEEEDDDDDENDAVEEEEESPVKKSTVAASSDDDSGSHSGSDSDETHPYSGFTIKPIVSKPPIDDVTKPKKSASKPSTSSTTKSKSGSKRPAAEPDPIEPDSKNNNKNKKKRATSSSSNGGGGGGDNEDAKKVSGIQRLWSEEDEVALLKGMSEYRTLKGSDPSADMGGFYEFIKKSMHFDLSKNQLVDKIRRLKKKYQNNVQKGEDPVFSKPHEHTAFVLSKKIWGVEANTTNNNNNNGVVVAAAADGGKTKKKSKQTTTTSSASNSKVNTNPITLALPSGKNPVLNLEAKANGDGEAKAKVKANGGGGGGGVVRVNNGDCEEKGDFWSNYPCLNGSLETGKVLALPEFGESFLRGRMSLIGSDKAEELEKKWRVLQEEELKLYLKKVDLVKQQTELALETIRASRS